MADANGMLVSNSRTAVDMARRVMELARCCADLVILYRDHRGAEPNAFENLWAMADEIYGQADVLLDKLCEVRDAIEPERRL